MAPLKKLVLQLRMVDRCEQQLDELKAVYQKLRFLPETADLNRLIALNLKASVNFRQTVDLAHRCLDSDRRCVRAVAQPWLAGRSMS